MISGHRTEKLLFMGFEVLGLAGSSILLKFIALRVEVLGDGPFVFVATCGIMFIQKSLLK